MLKVDKFDNVPPCKEAPQHRWIHDGVIWVLPGQPTPEYPYFWKCMFCGTKIRTQEPLPVVEFEGNVVEKITDE